MTKPSYLRYRPLTAATWKDFETLFGDRGACGGCWCMYWRLESRDFQRQKGAGNKRAMKRLVERKCPLGLLFYLDDSPVGWCSLSPRADLVRLATSRVLKPVDDAPVWSVSCFFIARPYRRQSLSVEMLRGAAEYARKQRIGTLEAYPVVPYAEKIPDAFAWTGFEAAFRRAGFVEVARRSRSRPVMRKTINRDP